MSELKICQACGWLGKAADVQVTVEVESSEFWGQKAKREVQREFCPFCGAERLVLHDGFCEACHGEGAEPSGTSHGGWDEMLECSKCGGTGKAQLSGDEGPSDAELERFSEWHDEGKEGWE